MKVRLFLLGMPHPAGNFFWRKYITGESAPLFRRYTMYNQFIRSPLESSKTYTAEHLLSLLRIAHKYCMDRLEQTTMEKFQQNKTTGGYIDLIVAAQIVGSDPIYQQALQALISSNPQPDLAQAKR